MSSITIAVGLPAARPRRSTRPVPAAARPRATVRPTGPSARDAVRLTARGRLVVAVLLAVLAVVALLAVTGPAGATASGSGAVAERVTVRPGETLWQIARRAAPGADPRATIARIQEMNALESSSVQAGRVLLVPRR
jgi:nucleoid-associated protein YgaU